jgi:hypothetical protein
MNVLIVGRTKMGGSSRCIGGISHDEKSVRLLTSAGGHWDTSAPFRIGQIWDIAYMPVAAAIRPHTEDVKISQYQLVGTEPNLRAHLLTRVTPWRGGIDQVFGGVLGYTGNNNGYVCRRLGVPAHSTWFWIPDRDLTLRSDGKHYDYPYGYGYQSRGLSYVGEPPALPTLPAGTLIRVSLARWWRPEDAEPDFEERCFLQLSGWYL